MSPLEFTFWLNGFFEIADPKSLDERQIQVIKDHIALVLKKETPDRNVPKQFEPKDPAKSLQKFVEELLQRKQETIPSYNPTINPWLNPLTPGLPSIPTYPPYTITCSDSTVSTTAVSPSDIATSAQCTTVDSATGITTSVEQKFDPNKPIFIC